MKSLIVYCFPTLFLLAHTYAAHDKPTQPQYPSRAAFAAQMENVERGMTPEQVTALLGKPDLVQVYVAKRDVDDSEVWLYGVTPKSHFPSLGQVHFNKDKKVNERVGSGGKTPPESLLSEATLRNLIDLLAGLAPIQIAQGGYGYDPLTEIKAVNTLQPYGRDRVLAVVNEYFRVTPTLFRGYPVLVLLRILFDPPNKHSSFPLLEDWETYPSAPADKTRVPRFPIVLVEDVPIYLVYDEPWGERIFDDRGCQRFLDYLKKYGRIRRTPLRPPPHPLAVLDRLAASDQWLFGKVYLTPWQRLRRLPGKWEVPNEDKAGKQFVIPQLLRLVRSVLPASSPYLYYIRTGIPAINLKEWPKIRAELSKLSIHWNPKINDYQLN